MEHLRELKKLEKLYAEFEATGDEGPICKEWANLCEEFRTAGDDYIKVFNAVLEIRKPAQITLENTLRRMDEFRKRFFEEKQVVTPSTIYL